MDIIVPAAGLSTRFLNMRPKYTLVDHEGKLMLYSAIKPFLGKSNIYVGILREHNDKYNVTSLLKHELGNDINIVVLDEQTSGPAETVYKIIQLAGIENKNEILIKDCDSFFDHEYLSGNYICISKFSDNDLIRRPKQKSYILTNDQGVVQNIAEKSILSDKFCVGGYKFESAHLYCDAFKNISKNKSEIYVSHVIQYCLYHNYIFLENIVNNYVDVGTSEDWFAYNDKAVIFCDIDGTLIESQSKQHYDKKAKPLNKNIDCIKKLIQENNQVIFVTARKEESREITSNMLESLGFKDFSLIMGLKNCKRILINDFNNANPYPRAISINIPRDSDTLESFL